MELVAIAAAAAACVLLQGVLQLAIEEYSSFWVAPLSVVLAGCGVYLVLMIVEYQLGAVIPIGVGTAAGAWAILEVNRHNEADQ